MMKKGRKREDKGLAVARFIIGFVMLLIILGALYWTLVELDYSDKIKNPEATIRPYVETTAIPATLATPVPASNVDLTAETPAPSEAPTPVPSPTATPEPTAEPTKVPAERYAQAINAQIELADTATENTVAALTACEVSVADENKVMTLTGYGYYNDARFDLSQADTYLVVVPQESPASIVAYAVTSTPGASGVEHTDAQFANPENADFQVVLDVSGYKNDIYTLKLAIHFADRYWFIYPFAGEQRFTVLDGQVISGVEITPAP